MTYDERLTDEMAVIHKFVTDMGATTKRNEKKLILKSWGTNLTVMRLLALTYNQYLTYGVTYDTIKKYNCAGLNKPMALLTVLESLHTRTHTGNAALQVCNDLLYSCPPMYRDLLGLIFDKELKIGIDAKTLNDVFPGCVPVFDITLAHSLKDSVTYQRRIDTENYLILRKLDGVRCITIIQNGSVEFLSRTGRSYTSLDKVKEELLKVFGTQSVVLDGEICVMDGEIEDFKAAVSQVRRLNFTMQNPRYKIFDILTMEEFKSETTSPNYSERLAKVHSIIKAQNCRFLSAVGAIRLNHNTLAASMRRVALQGWEGLILRADAPYKPGRSSDLLKVKQFTTEEFRCVGLKESTQRLASVDGGRTDVVCTRALTIEYKGNFVDVGYGMTEAQRIEFYEKPELVIGKMITVEYFQESQDASGKLSLRHPGFIAVREGGE